MDPYPDSLKMPDSITPDPQHCLEAFVDEKNDISSKWFSVDRSSSPVF
jgi:hypothetical protein